uniref:VWFA domain-containing protein n=1 Tax=Panagrolaimus davidi TaxID=227884 RepID=A0A914QLF7_9BILA
MNFIKSAIGALNYPSRLRVEGGYGGEFTWNSKLTISQMQSAINSAEQTSIPYSLLQQFSSLATNYQNLNDFYDSKALRNFTSNFLYWTDLSQPQPDNWDLLLYHAFGCENSNMSSSSKPTDPTSTPKLGSYYPCQNWITVLTDNSNKLSRTQFQEQLTFIKSIFGQTTHPERIRYGTYNVFIGNLVYPWDPNNDQDGLQNAVSNTNQTREEPDILKAIKLLAAVQNQNQTTPDSTLIFVTDTSNPNKIDQAVDLYNRVLKNIGIKLTFILTGEYAVANALSAFTDALIYDWRDIEASQQPLEWDISQAFRCTQQTIPPPSSMMPYIPCQSWITFAYDDSIVLPYSNFLKQLLFISSAIGNITHAERISAVGIYSEPIPWNSGETISQIQGAIDSVPQLGAYSLRLQFTAILTNMITAQTGNTPIAAIIFVPNTSNSALVGASTVFNQLTNVRITFVLLGTYPDQSKLTKFSSNFITWKDFSQPQPDNWNNIYYAAYGCQ